MPRPPTAKRDRTVSGVRRIGWAPELYMFSTGRTSHSPSNAGQWIRWGSDGLRPAVSLMTPFLTFSVTNSPMASRSPWNGLGAVASRVLDERQIFHSSISKAKLVAAKEISWVADGGGGPWAWAQAARNKRPRAGATRLHSDRRLLSGADHGHRLDLEHDVIAEEAPDLDQCTGRWGGHIDVLVANGA
jgi:hypothetical protein